MADDDRGVLRAELDWRSVAVFLAAFVGLAALTGLAPGAHQRSHSDVERIVAGLGNGDACGEHLRGLGGHSHGAM